MTIRAVLIGMLLGLAIAAMGYFNDWVLRLSFVASDLVPIGVYGLLMIAVLAVNPLLGIMRSRRFTAAELAVIVSLTLVACVIPGPGLMWHLGNSLVMPQFYQQVEPGWRRHQLVQYVPPVMLADVSEDYQKVVGGFCVGLRTNNDIGLGDVPWNAWTRTLAFWLPLIALSFIAGICLVLIVHRQWATRERLRYPIAAFASEMLETPEGKVRPAIMGNPRFWMGLALAGGVLLVNGFACWFPKSIQIPTQFDISPELLDRWPELIKIPFPINQALIFRLFFSAVGLAYLVSTEISFSVGVSLYLYVAVFILLAIFGVTPTGHYFEGGSQGFLLFGAYIAMGMTVFYLGRRFYLAVLARSLGIPIGESVETWIVRACRIALAAAATIVLMLTWIAGLHWILACLFVLLTGLVFLVVTRITAETGMFFIQPNWHALPVIVALLGMEAVGPRMLAILAMLSLVLTIDPRVCLMPLVANALKISQDQRIRPARIGVWMGAAVLAAMVAGVVGTLYVQYNYGGGTLYEFANMAARFPFEMLQRNLVKLGPDFGGGGLRVGNLHPDWRMLSFAGVGMAGVFLTGAMRLRYKWWPIHPVLFLVWGTLPSALYSFSFLLGWCIKAVITRLGGGRSYLAWKPLFVGLIAGEFLAAILWAIVGVVYYIKTGTAGPIFRTHM